MMKSKWAEKAKQNKAAAEKRKADKAAGIVPENNGWNKRRNATSKTMTVVKKHVAKISAADLSFAEAKIDAVKPFGIKPEDVSMQIDENGKEIQPVEPNVAFANLSNAAGSPFVIGLSQGGTIPPMFGVTCFDGGDYSLNLILDGTEEQRKLKKFTDDAQVALQTMARAAYGPCLVQHDDLIVRLYSHPSPKKNKPNEVWPPKLHVAIKAKDLQSGDTSIVKDDETKMSIIGNLAGMYWKEINVYLNCVKFGWIWSAKHRRYLPQIKILAKLLGRAIVTENPEHAHLVFPHQTLEHEAQNCVCKHHVPIDILQAPKPSELSFADPIPNKAGIGSVVDVVLAKDGTKLLLKFPRGGVLPSYAIDQNQQGKNTITLQFDDTKEFEACDSFKKNILDFLLQDRVKYFGENKSEELIRGFFKPLLKDASATAGNTTCRLITASVDISSNGTTCMLVDENDQLVTDPDALTSCRFTEVWISIFGVYINSGEAGFMKRITYLKRAPKSVSLVVD